MYIDNRILPSLHGSLSAVLLSTLPVGIYEWPRHRSRVLAAPPLYSNLYKAGGIERAFGFHDLKPALNGLCNVSEGFLMGLSLREASWEGRDFGDVITGFILFYQDMQFHGISFNNGEI
jgi:hypothetical protein